MGREWGTPINPPNPLKICSEHGVVAMGSRMVWGDIPMHDVNRRIFLGGLAALPALAALVAARSARARTGVPTVGYLSGGVKDGGLDVLYRGPIIKGLAEQGFVAPGRLRWLRRHA